MRFSFDHVITKNGKFRPLIRKRIRIGQQTPWAKPEESAAKTCLLWLLVRSCLQ